MKTKLGLLLSIMKPQVRAGHVGRNAKQVAQSSNLQDNLCFILPNGIKASMEHRLFLGRRHLVLKDIRLDWLSSQEDGIAQEKALQTVKRRNRHMNASSEVAKTIMFVLTHKCNLRCTYCYQNHKARDSRCMEVDFAKEKIGEAFRTVKAQKIYFDFIGGEVFTEWPRFKQICEWVMREERPVPYAITVSTNGTLITDEIKDWMRHHKDKVFLSLSLDGDDAMQFANRGTQNYNIDYRFFFETWPTQGIKMTLSDKTIPNLAAGIRFLHTNWGLGKNLVELPKNYENPISCNIAYGVDLSKDSYVALKRELTKLIDFYMGEGIDYFPTSILDVDFTYFKFDKRDYKVCKYCGAGTNITCYDVDGRVYPCQFFIPLTMSPRHLEILPNFTFAGEVRDPHCSNCAVETICPTCYGNNFKRNFDPFCRDKSLCIFTKLTLLANCTFQAKRILRKAEKRDADLYTLKVIDYLYPILSNEIETFEAKNDL